MMHVQKTIKRWEQFTLHLDHFATFRIVSGTHCVDPSAYLDESEKSLYRKPRSISAYWDPLFPSWVPQTFPNISFKFKCENPASPALKGSVIREY
jgi:hypothetical protein